MVSLDIDGYLRGFPKVSKREGVDSLIVADDPLGFTTILKDLDVNLIVEQLGSDPFLAWVVKQNQDPAAYKASVAKFKTAIATAVAKP